MSIASGIRSGLLSGLRSGLNPSKGVADPPTFQAAGTPQRGTAGLTVAWPTHQAGDVAYLVVINSHTASMSAASLSTPAGFTSVGSAETATISGLVTRITVFWCRATSGAMASPVTTANGSWSVGYIVTARGAIASGDPTDDFDTAVQDALDTSLSAGGNTTTGSNRLVLVLTGAICSGDITALACTNATLTSFTEQLDSQDLAGTERMHAGAYSGTLASAGGSGTTTGTYAATYAVWAAMTVAVKAA